MCATFPSWECFSERERPPAATLKRSEILHRSRWQTSSDVRMQTRDSRWYDTEIHVCAQCQGCLVDCHHRTLHSKCTFSWQTSSVLHFKCLSSLHIVLHKTIDTVYLHLSAIYLDYLFNLNLFTFVFFTMWLSEGFLSRFPLPPCLSGLRRGHCLSCYLCCALVLNCIPSQYKYSKVRAMCGVEE